MNYFSNPSFTLFDKLIIIKIENFFKKHILPDETIKT